MPIPNLQADLARAAGMTARVVRAIECAHCQASLVQALALTNALGVSLAAVLVAPVGKLPLKVR